jgi:hypothetical protein
VETLNRRIERSDHEIAQINQQMQEDKDNYEGRIEELKYNLSQKEEALAKVKPVFKSKSMV